MLVFGEGRVLKGELLAKFCLNRLALLLCMCTGIQYSTKTLNTEYPERPCLDKEVLYKEKSLEVAEPSLGSTIFAGAQGNRPQQEEEEEGKRVCGGQASARQRRNK